MYVDKYKKQTEAERERNRYYNLRTLRDDVAVIEENRQFQYLTKVICYT